MTTMGSYEARTHLSELLDHVAKGRTVLITRRGKPAALISPPPRQEQRDVHHVVQEMLAFRDREGPTLGGQVTIRELIDEGRRFQWAYDAAYLELAVRRALPLATLDDKLKAAASAVGVPAFAP